MRHAQLRSAGDPRETWPISILRVLGGCMLLLLYALLLLYSMIYALRYALRPTTLRERVRRDDLRTYQAVPVRVSGVL